MNNKHFKNYNRRRSNSAPGFGSGSQRHTTRWNIPRIVAACACLVGAIVLIILVPKLLASGDETPDNVASRISKNEPEASDMQPTSTATPVPVQTPEPTPENQKKAVALTFDDGPKSIEEDKGIKGTNGLLDTLKEYGAHATFFVQGYRCEINKEILNREIAEGHEIGNHSWDHPQLSKLSMDEVNKQLDRTANLVKELTDGYEIKLVRPPYGAVSQAMRKHLKHPMIIWSVDTLDWKDISKYTAKEKEQQILKAVKKEVSDGAIILMHDIHETSCEAAKIVVPWLIDHGYDVLTVSELMERKGINMKNGKVYASAESE